VAALPRRRFSLRTHLLLLVIGTLVPVLLLTLFLVRQLVNGNRANTERRLIEASRATAALVDAEISGTTRTLEALAQSGHLTTGDMNGFYDDARQLQATQATWVAVVLRRRDGTPLVNTYQPFGAAPIPTVDLVGVQQVFQTGRPVIGNLRLNTAFGTQPIAPIRVPVIRGGQVLYALTAILAPDRFAALLQRERAFPDEWVRGVMDANGVIVARTRDQARWVGERGTPGFMERIAHSDEAAYRDRSLDGADVYGAFTRAPRSRWIAGVGVPAAVVDGEFRRSMTLLGVLAAIVLAVGGLAAFTIARRIARDISTTVKAADAIAVGQQPLLPPASVTEVQRLADALERANTLLKERERERDERVSRADAARAEAEAADRAKDEFMAMLGHELRNPLAPALTALHLMKQRGGAMRRESEVVERQVRHLARLVDDLLDVSRVRRGVIQLRRERIAMSDVIARAVEMSAPLVDERQQALVVDVSPGLIIDGDQERLAQVFTNLIANAAKYTPPGGHITVTGREADGWAVVECADDGMGIAEELLPRVFDLFVQDERGLDRRQGGLGLGLGVAKTLVERHGGRIDAMSAGPGEGSTFVVMLPMPPASLESPATASPGAAVDLRGVRLLIVEDNPDALEMMVQSLSSLGLQVAAAPDAILAVRVALAFRPVVAVLDIGLPGTNGYELARQLRANEATSAIRLMALTGYGRDVDEEAAREAGFDVFLVKPIAIDVLLAHISDLVPSAAPARGTM
jgi:signal transduction histidine kinase/ActR/RegA family two-component response regulator